MSDRNNHDPWDAIRGIRTEREEEEEQDRREDEISELLWHDIVGDPEACKAACDAITAASPILQDPQDDREPFNLKLHLEALGRLQRRASAAAWLNRIGWGLLWLFVFLLGYRFGMGF